MPQTADTHESDAATKPTDVTADKAEAFMRERSLDDYTLLDVRQTWEYDEAHLPGARLVPLTELADRLGEVPRDKPVLTYCRSGGRSSAAAGLLAGQGYTALNILGGITAWQGAAAEGGLDQGLSYLPAAASMADILALAYAMEANLGDFYARCASGEDEEAKAVLQRLARFEEGHKAMVLRLARSHAPDVDEAALLARAREITAVEGGYGPEEASARLCAVKATRRDVLETAMAFEAQALDLYLRATSRAADPEAAAVLKELAVEEKKHMAVVGRMLDRTPS